MTAHRYAANTVARQHLAYPYSHPAVAAQVGAGANQSQHILATYIQQDIGLYHPSQGLVPKHVSSSPQVSPEQPSPATSSSSSATDQGDHPIGYGAFGVVW